MPRTPIDPVGKAVDAFLDLTPEAAETFLSIARRLLAHGRLAPPVVVPEPERGAPMGATPPGPRTATPLGQPTRRRRGRRRAATATPAVEAPADAPLAEMATVGDDES